MSPIPFNETPSNIRIPFFSVEIDASNASQGPALQTYKALLIGQKTAAGTAAANSLVKVTSAEQVRTLAGPGSLLHRMALAWFFFNQSTELWIGVLADDGAGVAASGTITVTGPATKAGTITLYLGGERITVAVANGDVQNTIAANINAAINAAEGLPVTSTVATNVVTVTFRHKGLTGNSFNMRDSYRDGEALPTGVALAYVQLAGGTTAPALASLIANMGDTQFHVIAHPYTDATNLGAIETELARRFGPMVMAEGLAITSAVGSHATLVSLGNGRNSPHSVILAQPGDNAWLTSPWEFAAEAASILAYYGQIDPARPFQTLEMRRALPPPESDRFTNSERNLLLFDGIGTTKVGPGEVVQLERPITTYQLNAAGAPDVAYLDGTTMLTLSAYRYTFRVRVQLKYSRHKLANDGVPVGAGQFIITPKRGKAEAVHWYEEMIELGLAENLEAFKANVRCERSITDVNRLDWYLPPDVMNQLIHGAARLAFRL